MPNLTSSQSDAAALRDLDHRRPNLSRLGKTVQRMDRPEKHAVCNREYPSNTANLTRVAGSIATRVDERSKSSHCIGYSGSNHQPCTSATNRVSPRIMDVRSESSLSARPATAAICQSALISSRVKVLIIGAFVALTCQNLGTLHCDR